MTMTADGGARVETAACLLIGNELLTGKIADRNLLPLSRTLRALGVRLTSASIVADEHNAIARDVLRLAADVDLLVTSGGVGPTHDDVTMEAIAQAFDVPLCEHAELRNLLRGAYQQRLTSAHLRMARVPEQARLITSDAQTWPLVVFRNVWIFPGVPELFRSKLALLRDSIRGPVRYFGCHVYTLLDEGAIKPALDAVVARHPRVEVGSYPRWFDPTHKTKITFDATDAACAQSALEDFKARVPTVTVNEIDETTDVE